MQLDDIPIHNKARDAAWAAFIKRKDVQEFFADKDDTFRFPLERGWYEVWCQAWAKALESEKCHAMRAYAPRDASGMGKGTGE